MSKGLSKIIKIILGFFGLIIVFGIIGSLMIPTGPTGRVTESFPEEETQMTTTTLQLITKSLSDMLPTRNDIPTEFTFDETEDVTIDVNGFESGKRLSISKIVGQVVSGIIYISFDAYRFSTIDDAEAYYNSIVNEVKSAGGYTELSVSVAPASKCFAYKQDYGFQARFGISNCVKRNIVFTTLVTTTQTYEKIEGYTKDMTKLFDSRIH